MLVAAGGVIYALMHLVWLGKHSTAHRDRKDAIADREGNVARNIEKKLKGFVYMQRIGRGIIRNSVWRGVRDSIPHPFCGNQRHTDVGNIKRLVHNTSKCLKSHKK